MMDEEEYKKKLETMSREELIEEAFNNKIDLWYEKDQLKYALENGHLGDPKKAYEEGWDDARQRYER